MSKRKSGKRKIQTRDLDAAALNHIDVIRLHLESLRNDLIKMELFGYPSGLAFFAGDADGILSSLRLVIELNGRSELCAGCYQAVSKS